MSVEKNVSSKKVKEEKKSSKSETEHANNKLATPEYLFIPSQETEGRTKMISEYELTAICSNQIKKKKNPPQKTH